MSNQGLITIIWLGAFVALFYFLFIRPQQQRSKQHRELMSSLKVGDKIVTAGGIHGKVKSISDDTVTVQVAENTKIVFDKSSVVGREEKTASSGGD